MWGILFLLLLFTGITALVIPEIMCVAAFVIILNIGFILGGTLYDQRSKRSDRRRARSQDHERTDQIPADKEKQAKTRAQNGVQLYQNGILYRHAIREEEGLRNYSFWYPFADLIDIEQMGRRVTLHHQNQTDNPEIYLAKADAQALQNYWNEHGKKLSKADPDIIQKLHVSAFPVFGICTAMIIGLTYTLGLLEYRFHWVHALPLIKEFEFYALLFILIPAVVIVGLRFGFRLIHAGCSISRLDLSASGIRIARHYFTGSSREIKLSWEQITDCSFRRFGIDLSYEKNKQQYTLRLAPLLANRAEEVISFYHAMKHHAPPPFNGSEALEYEELRER